MANSDRVAAAMAALRRLRRAVEKLERAADGETYDEIVTAQAEALLLVDLELRQCSELVQPALEVLREEMEDRDESVQESY